MTEARFVNALALGLDPAWRHRTRDERCRDAEEFCAAATARAEVNTFTYSTIGFKAGVDVVLWSLAPSLEALEEQMFTALPCRAHPLPGMTSRSLTMKPCE